MRVLIAISGGLDSAAAALILKSQGHQIQGLYINMHNRQGDIDAANKVAKLIDIPLVVVDATTEFQNSVLNYFKTQLAQGRTPAPCSFCNPNLKWSVLYEYARKNNFDLIATGHYVQTVVVNSKTFIKKGADTTKDQSYYLWDLPQKILSKTIFPLGVMTKLQVRKMLADRGFDHLSRARESMSLCFIDKGVDYADFVRSVVECREGEIIDMQGNTVGNHSGIPLYTIGQKRGFECIVAGAGVVEMDVVGNRLIVSAKDEDLYKAEFKISDWRVEDFSMLYGGDIYLKVRGLGRNPQGGFRVEKNGENLLVTLSEDKAWAVASGQPVVFYRGDVLAGGGYVI